MSTLESLPPEILFNILSHLSPFNSRPLRGLHNHPLELLAQTSHRLSHITEDYARHLLLVHAKKTPRLRASGPKYRDIWFRWLLTTCQDCKRSSQRLSIFEPSMTLCKNCDKKVGKMTMTDAATKHGLSKLDLFTPNPLHASLPPLTHGTYNCMGTAAVMLLETDVLARKTHIHGLLAAASGPDAVTPPALNRRVAAHTRIAAALGIAWYQVYWRNVGHGDGGGGGDFAPPSADMQSLRAGKLHYAREQIKRQWAAMGLEETELDLEGYW